MGDSRGGGERLPWLETAPVKDAAAPPTARHARTPLLLLLALLAAGFIAALAFLAGRTTAPGNPRPTPSAPVKARLPAPVPPAPVATAVIPRPTASPVVTAPAPPPRVTAVERRRAARPTRRYRRNPIPRITRVFPLSPVATATPRRSTTRVAPSSARPRGDVVQLGAYVTMPLANAAWARLVGAYPYLSTLPRSVTVSPPSPGRPLYYRLRVAAGSRAQARALCNHLHRIGRGCMMVTSAK